MQQLTVGFHTTQNQINVVAVSEEIVWSTEGFGYTVLHEDKLVVDNG